jgi:hypothetical protein
MIPDIPQLVRKLVEEMHEGKHAELERYGYPTLIANFGGVENVITDVLSSIDEEILELKGKEIGLTE